MSFLFDGPNKLIVMSPGIIEFSAKDLYSRWKEWVLVSDNSKYEYAFASVAGDSIGAGQTIAPYIFLNTFGGWRIRPQEANHQLRINGNLYSIDSTLDLFVPTLGNFTVITVVERSSAAIATTVGGVDQATVQAALTAQGYTTTRSTALDGVGALSVDQANMLLEMYRILGLDPTKPLVVDTPTSGPGYRRIPANGSSINQTIVKTGTTTTVTRV